MKPATRNCHSRSTSLIYTPIYCSSFRSIPHYPYITRYTPRTKSLVQIRGGLLVKDGVR